MGYAKKSPWVIHYDGSSCNGCDIEVLATLCPGFDAERFGVINTGNPKHADIFLVTGSVNEQNAPVIKQIYDQMIEPKVVVACGICACTGGIFKDCYNVWGGVDTVIPVDAYVPGCAVRPESLIDAVVAGVDILEQREAELKCKKSKTVSQTTDSNSIKNESADVSTEEPGSDTKLEDSSNDVKEQVESKSTVTKETKEDSSKITPDTESVENDKKESPQTEKKEADND